MQEALFSKLERDIKTIENRQAQADSFTNQNFMLASDQFQSHKKYAMD